MTQNNKLTEMLKRAVKATCGVENDTEGNLTYYIESKDLNSLITEVWNEAYKQGVEHGSEIEQKIGDERVQRAIKECEGCVPGELSEVTLQDPYAMERNIGFNTCREQTLAAVSKLRV